MVGSARQRNGCMNPDYAEVPACCMHDAGHPCFVASLNRSLVPFSLIRRNVRYGRRMDDLAHGGTPVERPHDIERSLSDCDAHQVTSVHSKPVLQPTHYMTG